MIARPLRSLVAALLSVAHFTAPSPARADVCESPFTAVAAARSTASAQRIALLSRTQIHHSTDAGAHFTSLALATENVRDFLVNEDGTALVTEGPVDSVRLRVVAPDGSVRLDRSEISVVYSACAHGVLAYIESARLRVSRDLGRTWQVAIVPTVARSVPTDTNAVSAPMDLRIEPDGSIRVLENFAEDETGTPTSAVRVLTCTRVRSEERCRQVVFPASDWLARDARQLAPNGALIARDSFDQLRILRGRTWSPLLPQPRFQGLGWLASDNALLFFASRASVWRLDGETFSTVTTAIPAGFVHTAADALGRLVVALPRRVLRRDAPHAWTTLVDCARGAS
ncbi:MAG: hypothetical protein JNK05_02255 [Myxococcales bacterium]|nr:hypothetical protein [Myxococcales bacterium]